jgi:hypothetical protein
LYLVKERFSLRGSIPDHHQSNVTRANSWLATRITMSFSGLDSSFIFVNTGLPPENSTVLDAIATQVGTPIALCVTKADELYLRSTLLKMHHIHLGLSLRAPKIGRAKEQEVVCVYTDAISLTSTDVFAI